MFGKVIFSLYKRLLCMKIHILFYYFLNHLPNADDGFSEPFQVFKEMLNYNTLQYSELYFVKWPINRLHNFSYS